MEKGLLILTCLSKRGLQFAPMESSPPTTGPVFVDTPSSTIHVYDSPNMPINPDLTWDSVDWWHRKKDTQVEVGTLEDNTGNPCGQWRWGQEKLLFIVCLLIVLTATSGTSVKCPEGCSCPWSEMSAHTGPTATSRQQHPSAFAAINCSNLELTQLILHFHGVTDDKITRNKTIEENDSTGNAYDKNAQGIPRLESLDLSHNLLMSAKPLTLAVGEVQNHTFALKTNVLDLSHNDITDVQANDLSTFKEVESLDLSHNRLLSLDPDAFLGLETLAYLNLSHNAIYHLANVTFRPLVRLKILDLSFNNLQTLLFEQLRELSLLEYLYLNDNNIHLVTTSSAVEFPPLPSLVYLDMSSNQLEGIPHPIFHALSSLVTLDLTNCSIIVLNPQFLLGLKSIEQLYLDQNDFNAIDRPVFQNTPMKRLSMASMPNLGNISHVAFLGLSQLIYLNLSHNSQLSFIQPNLFTPLMSLQILDMSHSGLTQLSEITFNTNKALAEVLLQHNPFICSCVNAWLRDEALSNQSKFLNSSSLSCLNDQGLLTMFTNANISCEELRIYNMTSKISAKLGSKLLLKCQYDTEEPCVLTWKTPKGEFYYHHHFHPDASQHLLTPMDIDPESPFHRNHYWHHSSSYHSELDSFKERLMILTDGSLYIDYMLKSDAGTYLCQVSNGLYNHSARVTLYVDCKLSTDVKLYAYLAGLLSALGFFTLNLIYVIISWIARRLVNKRRREIIRQMLENLNLYKSAQVSRIHENYTHQLSRVRNQYHIQRDKLHRNYASQVARMKRGCSNQVERVRDNYHSKLNQLRDYSSNQVIQIRERANNQIIRIRDYGSLQLDKLRETYKLQQQHVLKLLDTMNLENCRNVVETECMRTESMMYDIDLLGDDDHTDSPVSPAESEYTTAASSPGSSLDCPSEDGLLDQDMHHLQIRELSDDSMENKFIIDMQTTLDLEAAAEPWQYHTGYKSYDDVDAARNYPTSAKSKSHGREPLLEFPSLLAIGRPQNVRLSPLPTLEFIPNSTVAEIATSPYRHSRANSDGVGDGAYMTPETSPTKIWPSGKNIPNLEQTKMEHLKHNIHKDGISLILDTDSSETIL